jgi:hypothetical protein
LVRETGFKVLLTLPASMPSAATERPLPIGANWNYRPIGVAELSKIRA